MISSKGRFLALGLLITVLSSLWYGGAHALELAESLLVNSWSMPDLHQLEVYFVPPFDPVLAQRASSFRLSRLGAPSSVVIKEDEHRALLTFHIRLIPGETYTLTTPGGELHFVARENIRFDSLGEKVRARNTTVQVASNARSMLDSTYGMLTEGRDALYSAYLDLTSQINALPGFTAPFPNPPADSPQEAINDAVAQLDGVLRDTLESNRQSLMTQLMSLENQRTDLVSSMERLRQQNEFMVKQFTWAAESMLLGYHTLSSQLEALEGNRTLLQKQLTIARLQEQLEMITAADVQALELALEDIDSGLRVLPQQMENIRRELNLLLGQTYDTDIAFEPVMLDLLDIADIEWDKNRQKAINNNTSLNLLSLEVQSKYNAIYRHALGSHQRRLAELEWENARLQLMEERRRLNLALTRQKEDARNKYDAWERELSRLGLEEEKFRHTTLRHQLGLLSEVQFMTESISLEGRQRALEDARRELFSALRKYHWMVEGLSL